MPHFVGMWARVVGRAPPHLGLCTLKAPSCRVGAVPQVVCAREGVPSDERAGEVLVELDCVQSASEARRARGAAGRE